MNRKKDSNIGFGEATVARSPVLLLLKMEVSSSLKWLLILPST